MIGAIQKAAARPTAAARLVSFSARRLRTSTCQWRSYHASPMATKSASPATDSNNTIDNNGGDPPVQPFVKQNLQPQEWDPLSFQNPLYHPTYKARSKVLSNEDFQKRPEVRFEDQLDSMADAQVVFSHITHKEMQGLYDEYKMNLSHGHSKYGITSHEYIVRLLAQKHNMQAPRLAAIIQLMSNEEEMRKNGEELRDDFGEYMDYAYKKEIADCYRAHGMKLPQQMYVEQPTGRYMMPPSKKYNEVPDTVDMDEAWRRYTEEYLPQKARKIIQTHRYVEDEDDDQVPIPNDKDVLAYVDKYDKIQSNMKEHFGKIKVPDEVKNYHETFAPKQKKTRNFKWVAQMVNTRALKKEKKAFNRRPDYTWKSRGKRRMSVMYSNDSPKNTLVNEDGKLRPGTLEDVRNVAWKPRRRDYGYEGTMESTTAVMEFIYRDAKLKWLDQIKGRSKKQQQQKAAAAAAAEEESAADEDGSEETEEVEEEATASAEEDASTDADTAEPKEDNDKPSS